MKRKLYMNSYNTSKNDYENSDSYANNENRASLISSKCSFSNSDTSPEDDQRKSGTRSIGVQVINKLVKFSQTSVSDDQFTCTSHESSTSSSSAESKFTKNTSKFTLDEIDDSNESQRFLQKSNYSSSSSTNSCNLTNTSNKSSIYTDGPFSKHDGDEEEEEEDEDEDEDDDDASSLRANLNRCNNPSVSSNKIRTISSIFKNYCTDQSGLERRYVNDISNYKILKLCVSGNKYISQPAIYRCRRVDNISPMKIYNEPLDRFAYRSSPEYYKQYLTRKDVLHENSDSLRSGGINNRPLTAPHLYQKRYNSNDNFNNIRKIYIPSTVNNSNGTNLVRRRYYIVGSRVEIKRFKESHENFSNPIPRKIIKNCSKHCVHCLFGHDIDQNATRNKNGDSWTDYTSRNCSTDDSESEMETNVYHDPRHHRKNAIRKIENTRNCIVCSKNTRLSGGNNDGEDNYLSPVKSAIVRLKHFSEKIDTQEKILKSLEKIGSSVNYRLAKDQEGLKTPKRSKVKKLSICKLRKKSKRNVHTKQADNHRWIKTELSDRQNRLKKKRAKEKTKPSTETVNVIICEQKGKPNKYQSEKNTQAEIKNVHDRTEEMTPSREYVYTKKQSFYARKKDSNVRQGFIDVPTGSSENEKYSIGSRDFSATASLSSDLYVVSKRIRGGDSKFLQNSKCSSSKQQKYRKPSGILKSAFINNFSVFGSDYPKTCTNETCKNLNMYSTTDSKDFEIDPENGSEDDSKTPLNDKNNPKLSDLFKKVSKTDFKSKCSKLNYGKNTYPAKLPVKQRFSFDPNINDAWNKIKNGSDSKIPNSGRNSGSYFCSGKKTSSHRSKKQHPPFMDYRKKVVRTKTYQTYQLPKVNAKNTVKKYEITDKKSIGSSEPICSNKRSYHKEFDTCSLHEPKKSSKNQLLETRPVSENSKRARPHELFDEMLSPKCQEMFNKPLCYFQVSRSNLEPTRTPNKNAFSDLLQPVNKTSSKDQKYTHPKHHKMHNGYEESQPADPNRNKVLKESDVSHESVHYKQNSDHKVNPRRQESYPGVQESRYDKGTYEVNVFRENDEWNFSWKSPNAQKHDILNRRKTIETAQSSGYEKPRRTGRENTYDHNREQPRNKDHEREKLQQNLKNNTHRSQNALKTYAVYQKTSKDYEYEKLQQNPRRDVQKLIRSSKHSNLDKPSTYRNLKVHKYEKIRPVSKDADRDVHKSSKPRNQVNFHSSTKPSDDEDYPRISKNNQPSNDHVREKYYTILKSTNRVPYYGSPKEIDRRFLRDYAREKNYRTSQINDEKVYYKVYETPRANNREKCQNLRASSKESERGHVKDYDRENSYKSSNTRTVKVRDDERFITGSNKKKCDYFKNYLDNPKLKINNDLTNELMRTKSYDSKLRLLSGHNKQTNFNSCQNKRCLHYDKCANRKLNSRCDIFGDKPTDYNRHSGRIANINPEIGSTSQYGLTSQCCSTSHYRHLANKDINDCLPKMYECNDYSTYGKQTKFAPKTFDKKYKKRDETDPKATIIRTTYVLDDRCEPANRPNRNEKRRTNKLKKKKKTSDPSLGKINSYSSGICENPPKKKSSSISKLNIFSRKKSNSSTTDKSKSRRDKKNLKTSKKRAPLRVSNVFKRSEDLQTVDCSVYDKCKTGKNQYSKTSVRNVYPEPVGMSTPMSCCSSMSLATSVCAPVCGIRKISPDYDKCQPYRYKTNFRRSTRDDCNSCVSKSNQHNNKAFTPQSSITSVDEYCNFISSRMSSTRFKKNNASDLSIRSKFSCDSICPQILKRSTDCLKSDSSHHSATRRPYSVDDNNNSTSHSTALKKTTKYRSSVLDDCYPRLSSRSDNRRTSAVKRSVVDDYCAYLNNRKDSYGRTSGPVASKNDPNRRASTSKRSRCCARNKRSSAPNNNCPPSHATATRKKIEYSRNDPCRRTLNYKPATLDECITNKAESASNSSRASNSSSRKKFEYARHDPDRRILTNKQPTVNECNYPPVNIDHDANRRNTGSRTPTKQNTGRASTTSYTAQTGRTNYSHRTSTASDISTADSRKKDKKPKPSYDSLTSCTPDDFYSDDCRKIKSKYYSDSACDSLNSTSKCRDSRIVTKDSISQCESIGADPSLLHSPRDNSIYEDACKNTSVSKNASISKIASMSKNASISKNTSICKNINICENANVCQNDTCRNRTCGNKSARNSIADTKSENAFLWDFCSRKLSFSKQPIVCSNPTCKQLLTANDCDKSQNDKSSMKIGERKKAKDSFSREIPLAICQSCDKHCDKHCDLICNGPCPSSPRQSSVGFNRPASVNNATRSKDEYYNKYRRDQDKNKVPHCETSKDTVASKYSENSVDTVNSEDGKRKIGKETSSNKETSRDSAREKNNTSGESGGSCQSSSSDNLDDYQQDKMKNSRESTNRNKQYQFSRKSAGNKLTHDVTTKLRKDNSKQYLYDEKKHSPNTCDEKWLTEDARSSDCNVNDAKRYGSGKEKEMSSAENLLVDCRYGRARSNKNVKSLKKDETRTSIYGTTPKNFQKQKQIQCTSQLSKNQSKSECFMESPNHFPKNNSSQTVLCDESNPSKVVVSFYCDKRSYGGASNTSLNAQLKSAASFDKTDKTKSVIFKLPNSNYRQYSTLFDASSITALASNNYSRYNKPTSGSGHIEIGNDANFDRFDDATTRKNEKKSHSDLVKKTPSKPLWCENKPCKSLRYENIPSTPLRERYKLDGKYCSGNVNNWRQNAATESVDNRNCCRSVRKTDFPVTNKFPDRFKTDHRQTTDGGSVPHPTPDKNFSQFFGICDFSTCHHYGVKKVLSNNDCIKDQEVEVQEIPNWYEINAINNAPNDCKKSPKNSDDAMISYCGKNSTVLHKIPVQFPNKSTGTLSTDTFKRNDSNNFNGFDIENAKCSTKYEKNFEDKHDFTMTSLASKTSLCSSRVSQYSFKNMHSIQDIDDHARLKKENLTKYCSDLGLARSKSQMSNSMINNPPEDSKSTILSIDMLLEKCGLSNEFDQNKMYDFNIKITKSSELKNLDSDDSALSVKVKKFNPVRAAYHASIKNNDNSHTFNSVHSLKINNQIWQKNSKNKIGPTKELNIHNNKIEKLIVFTNDQHKDMKLAKEFAKPNACSSMMKLNTSCDDQIQNTSDYRCETDNSLFDYFVTDINPTTSNDSLFGA